MAAQEAQTFNWHYDELDDKNFHVHGGGVLLLAVSFFLLLLFTLLCLYMRWACRRRLLHASAVDASSGSSSSNAAVHRAAGLDPETIASFPVHLHRASEGPEDAQCSICLVGFEDGDKVKALPGCNHGFHPECVDAWLRTQSSCPLCRGALGAPDPPLELELELVVH